MVCLCVFSELGRSYDNLFLNFTVLTVAWPHIKSRSVGFNTSRVTLPPVINIQYSVCCVFSNSDCISPEVLEVILIRNTFDRLGRCCSHWAGCVVGLSGLVRWEPAREAAAQLVAACCKRCWMNRVGKLSLWSIVSLYTLGISKTVMTQRAACTIILFASCLSSIFLLHSHPLFCRSLLFPFPP